MTLPTHARVVIIGGGIVGGSTAYHLSKRGWRDIAVLDQGPLFKNLGSTSHAPGLMFQHNNSKTVCTLAQWSVETYLEAERAAANGQVVWQVGSLEIAETPERWHELKRKQGNAYAWGLAAHLIGRDEIKKLVPIMRVDDLYGAFYVPSDCDVHGVNLTAALAQLAGREGAATFHPNTPVTGIDVERGRVKAVITPQGRIEAEIVICAAGLWGPVIGKMVGLTLPMTPMQHLYVKSEPLAELADETEEVRHPIVRAQDKDMYYRQHKSAYGFGSYRHAPLVVPAEALPRNDHPAIFEARPADVEEAWAEAAERFPALQRAAIAQQFNGLFSFTTDGNTILGESPDVRGFWVAEAVWVTHAGGTGRALADWLVHGDPGLDVRELDINRFHPHTASRRYLHARADRQYIEVYDIIHPLQQMENPRPLRVPPFHERLKALGGVFFESSGWEKAQWFESNARHMPAQPDWPSRTGWHARYWSPLAGVEHRATRERVGLFDIAAFAKFEVRGPDALAFLQYLTANNLDQPVGRVTYTSMLTAQGGIKCDLTVTRLGPDRFWILTGGGTGPMDFAWIRRNLPEGARVELTNVSSAYTAIGVWGPRARDLVQAVSESDLSNEAFPYMTAQTIIIDCVPVLAVRISYVGELGWELYTPPEYGLRLWDVLWESGQQWGAVPVGLSAFDSLRLEKGYRLWGSDIHTEYNPYEAGLGFAVRLKKGEFLGRAALEKAKAAGAQRRLCCLVLDEPNAALMGREPIFAPGTDERLSFVTSANYGYSVNQSIAYGYLPLTHAAEGTPVEIYSFGSRHRARVVKEPLYDPENVKLKC